MTCLQQNTRSSKHTRHGSFADLLASVDGAFYSTWREESVGIIGAGIRSDCDDIVGRFRGRLGRRLEE